MRSRLFFRSLRSWVRHAALTSAVMGAATLMGAREGAGQAWIPEIHQSLADVDRRQGAVEPTPEQLRIVEAMGASASWTSFGTPRSLVNHEGFLATGLSADPVTAAREWVLANAALFRLSSQGLAGLELHRAARLAGTNAHAVIFRQRFADVVGVHDGILTVGVVNGSIAYASSSVTGDAGPSGSVKVSPVEAWLSAARDVGGTATAADVGSIKQEAEWTVFAVKGFAQRQRARLVALPTPLSGVRRAYQTLLVDVQGGSATAFTHFVDAESGAPLVRRNIVYQSHQPVNTFTGAVPQTDGACVQATHVRLVTVHNQCSGNAEFHGIQDDDVTNVTDCRTGREVTPPGSLAARDREVRAAELQVFASAGGVR